MSVIDQRARNAMAPHQHCTVTARLRRFSSCDGQHPECTEFDCDNDAFRVHFKARFYANGSCTEDEGHVSILFHSIYLNYQLYYILQDFSCIASVIDASGSQRFSRSYHFNREVQAREQGIFTFGHDLGFHRFVKRSTLLNDPSELLPDDCLTLRLEIDYEVKRPLEYIQAPFYLWMDNKCHILKNSDFMRDLCKMSAVFRSMLESPMAERESDNVSIPLEELESLQFIFAFLNDLHLDVKLTNVLELYVFADKYNMQEIVDLSLELLMTVMRTAMNSQKMFDYVEKGLHVISGLAERFDDQRLKDILKLHSYVKNKFEGGSDPLEFPSDVYLETEWNCELEERAIPVLVFKKNLQSDSFK